MATTRLFSAADLSELADDENWYELVNGELVQVTPTNYRHGQMSFWVGRHFLNYADDHGGEVTGAESGFLLHIDPDTMLAPDIAYVRSERAPLDSEKDRFSEVVPDLVVEIVSPTDRPGLRRRKIAAYQAAGVPLVLILNSRRRTLTIHRIDGSEEELREGDGFDGGDVMPGFRLPVAQFFR